MTILRDPLYHLSRQEQEYNAMKVQLKIVNKQLDSDKRKFMEQYILNRALTVVSDKMQGELQAVEASKAWETMLKILKGEDVPNDPDKGTFAY